MSTSADRGAAVVLVVTATAILVAAAGAFAALGLGKLYLQQAQSGADLAALAAARELGSDPAAACPQAARTAQANGVHLIDCRPLGLQVEVQVRRAAPGPLRHLLPGGLRAQARAGLDFGLAGLG